MPDDKTRAWKKQRNEEITQRYVAGGVTYKALGEEYGLVKERVRQIIASVQMKKYNAISRLDGDEYEKKKTEIAAKWGSHPTDRYIERRRRRYGLADY